MPPRKKAAKTTKKNPAPAPPKQDLETSKKQKKEEPLYVAGIGASAGGLESFERFFKQMPADSGLAFVLVSHLDPTHSSIMPQIIQKHTAMKVVQAKDGMKVQPNHVYFIPPNKDLGVLHGTLQLIEPSGPAGVRLPIDYFLRSLAQDQREKAIGIILSGMGSDGTLGLRAIKGELGMVMAQSPESAKSDGMPRSAIATDLVDYVLPPEQMPEQLLRYVKGASHPTGTKLMRTGDGLSDEVQKICILLRSQTGHDFSCYKPSTINRRLERRMNVHQIRTLSQYLRYLQENPQEADQLFRELLIGVTSFFRDPEAFEVLKQKVLPALFKDKPKGYCFRVWVPACSTGEEAYSIAILFREYMDKIGRYFDVQIFGTDIDAHAIEAARTGAYPASISTDVSPKRLNRFFSKDDGLFRVKKEIRETLVLAVQDVLKDPPFTKLDLLSCRNLLIYFEAALQKKLLPLFHYGLRPDGFLFLGSSETVGQFADLFSVVDKKAKLYRRKDSSLSLDHPFPHFPVSPLARLQESLTGGTETEIDVFQTTARLILEKFGPAGVVVNDKGEILHIHGRTGKYLEPSSGKARMNVFEMAREGLRLEAAAAVRRAAAEGKTLVQKGVRVKTNSDFEWIDLTVMPVKGLQQGEKGLFLMVFQDSTPPTSKAIPKRKGKPETHTSGRVQELELELAHTKESLQTTFEEMQTSNEELKSMNEELQSTNEELQSSNEELETSKEELQSLHEEVVTVNAELESKVDQLSATNNDMKNLLDSTEVPTIFLDNDMRIRNFTKNATAIVNLIRSDIGRPLKHILLNLKYKGLIDDAENMLRSLTRIEKEVETNEGRWYLMRIMPYRTLENAIDGVVVVFTDIHEQRKAREDVKKLNEEVQAARRFAENIVDTLREPLVVLDHELRIVSANQSFYYTFQLRQGEATGKVLFELQNHQWDIPELRQSLSSIIQKGDAMERLVIEREFPQIGLKRMVLNARRLVHRKGQPLQILLVFEERGRASDAAVTSQKRD